MPEGWKSLRAAVLAYSIGAHARWHRFPLAFSLMLYLFVIYGGFFNSFALMCYYLHFAQSEHYIMINEGKQESFHSFLEDGLRVLPAEVLPYHMPDLEGHITL